MMAEKPFDYFNLLRSYASKGNAKGVEETLPLVLDAPNGQLVLSLLLVESVRFGFLDVFNLLLPHADPKHSNSSALRDAARTGKPEFLDILIQIADPQAERNEAIRMAADKGHLECVKMLLPKCTRVSEVKRAMMNAASGGHAETLDVFVKFFTKGQPIKRDYFDETLMHAAQSGSAVCVKMVLPYADEEKARRELLARTNSTSALNLLDSVIQEKRLKERHMTGDVVRKKESGL